MLCLEADHIYPIVMRIALVGFVLITIMSGSCTRRPVQKDVVINGPPRPSEIKRIESSKGAVYAPLELQIIDTLIQLYLSTIDAEQLAATRTGRSELKSFAKFRISEQQQEIVELKDLRGRWFSNADPAVNIDLPNVQAASDSIDLEKLDPLKERAFDLEFVNQMIAHDDATSAFAKYVSSANVRDELNQIIEKIVREKSGEVEQMRKWQNEGEN